MGLTAMYQCWFCICDKCTITMWNISSRGTGLGNFSYYLYNLSVNINNSKIIMCIKMEKFSLEFMIMFYSNKVPHVFLRASWHSTVCSSYFSTVTNLEEYYSISPFPFPGRNLCLRWSRFHYLLTSAQPAHNFHLPPSFFASSSFLFFL